MNTNPTIVIVQPPANNNALVEDKAVSKSRSGRWTIQEITVVDELCRLFEAGMLPLPSSLKLSDFLSSFLSCKSSRLTKKLRMGNLSQLYTRESGFISNRKEAYELSSILSAFYCFLPELQPRAEAIWRENFFNLCLELRVPVANAAEVLGGMERNHSVRKIAANSNKSVTKNRSGSLGGSSIGSETVAVTLENHANQAGGSTEEDCSTLFEYGFDALLQDNDFTNIDDVGDEEDGTEATEVSVSDRSHTKKEGSFCNKDIMHFEHNNSSHDVSKKKTDATTAGSSTTTTGTDINTGSSINLVDSLCNLLARHMPLIFAPNDAMSLGYTRLRLALLRHQNGLCNEHYSAERDVTQIILGSYNGYCSVNGGPENITKDVAQLIVKEYLMLCGAGALGNMFGSLPNVPPPQYKQPSAKRAKFSSNDTNKYGFTNVPTKNPPLQRMVSNVNKESEDDSNRHSNSTRVTHIAAVEMSP